MILELLEAMEVEFDDDGRVTSRVSVLVNPKTFTLLQRIPQPADYMERLNRVFRRKWEQHLAQKRPRQLSE
jgi:hypothetical protein